MGLTSTCTHTHYFGEDQVAELLEVLDRLDADFLSRQKFIPLELQVEGQERLMAVRLAIRRLGDRAT